MNKEIMRLLSNLKILNGGELTPLMDEEISAIAGEYPENGDITISKLNDDIEASMSYWEND